MFMGVLCKFSSKSSLCVRILLNLVYRHTYKQQPLIENNNNTIDEVGKKYINRMLCIIRTKTNLPAYSQTRYQIIFRHNNTIQTVSQRLCRKTILIADFFVVLFHVIVSTRIYICGKW